MKKKQSKKKISNKKKSNITEKPAFANPEKNSKTINTTKSSANGIPKYVADRMARRIFFTAGIPTIMGMSVFIVSYFFVIENIPMNIQRAKAAFKPATQNFEENS